MCTGTHTKDPHTCRDPLDRLQGVMIGLPAHCLIVSFAHDFSRPFKEPKKGNKMPQLRHGTAQHKHTNINTCVCVCVCVCASTHTNTDALWSRPSPSPLSPPPTGSDAVMVEIPRRRTHNPAATAATTMMDQPLTHSQWEGGRGEGGELVWGRRSPFMSCC